MTYLGKAPAADVKAACESGALEIGSALSRLIGATVEVGVLPVDQLVPAFAPPELQGPGLMVLLTLEGSGALLALPESSELLPSWYSHPDGTGQSVLTTLAQELGMLVLPEEYMPEGFKAAHVASLAEAIERGGVAAGANLLPLKLTAPSGKQATMSLIWPADLPGDVFAAEAAESKAAVPPAAANPAPPAPAIDLPPTAPPQFTPRQGAARPAASASSIEELPTYSRSLLRIKVPVIVTLAETKQPIGRIVELGPGTIIQFDKSCEEMLSLQVGGQPVAEGEAVKVGDKFGIRLTSLKLPGERFKPVKTRR